MIYLWLLTCIGLLFKPISRNYYGFLEFMAVDNEEIELHENDVPLNLIIMSFLADVYIHAIRVFDPS